jgi:N-methylhydantoinase A
MKVLDQQDIKKLVEDFDERYIKIYGPGAAAPETGYTLKTYKVVGIGKIGLSHFKAVAPDHAGEKLSPKGERVALADTDTGEMRSIPIYDGNQLSVGAEFAGPAVAEFWNTSVLVPNGWSARVDERSDIILQRQ